jgi:Domain of unknown function (DUF4157)
VSTRMQIPAKPMIALHPASEPFGILRRKCACGGSGGSGGECAECKKKKLQRRAAGGGGPETVPPIVHDVLRSPGQPLDAQTRAFFHPRFGHDFGSVRVHYDNQPPDSPRAVGAQAAPPRALQHLPANACAPVLFDQPREVEAGHTDCDWDRAVKPDEVFVPKSGDPKVKIRTEDPCAQECTIEHEATHVGQLKPICKTYFDCYTQAPAKAASSDMCKGFTGADLKKCQDLVTLQLRLECFLDAGNAWEAEKWECEGYKTSLSCADKLLSKATPQCRQKIQEYKDSAKKQIDKYCKAAPAGGGAQPPPPVPPPKQPKQ